MRIFLRQEDEDDGSVMLGKALYNAYATVAILILVFFISVLIVNTASFIL